ncbi:MAG: hypothetical protein GY861_24625, partial [bacterium]|nr:hypothetical protein [bacterium]
QPEMEETPEDITLTPEELEQKILDAVEEATKAKVGSPNKGSESTQPLDNTPVVKKNWFEEIV